MRNSGYYSNRAAVIIITHEEGNISSSLTSGVFEARGKRLYFEKRRKERHDVFWREGRPLPASPFAWSSSSLLLSSPPSFSFSSSSSSSSSSYNNSSSSS